MKCEQLDKCGFFKTKGMRDQPCVIEKLKSIYCEGSPLLCARRRVAQLLGPEHIPNDLHPDHAHRVQEIIINGLSED